MYKNKSSKRIASHSAAGQTTVAAKVPSAPSMQEFMQATHHIEICVSELQLGMYVSNLDCDWLETPFLVQGFVIETLDDIDLLAHYCKRVWVDQKVDHLAVSGKHHRQALMGVVQPTIHKIPTRRDIDRSGLRHRDASAAARGLISGIRMGEALKTEQAKLAVSSCVRNVMADPGVALLVAKIQERVDSAAEHALNVCIITLALGRFLGFNESELHKLGICALLHDVGKVKLDEALLALSVEQMNDVQREQFEAHTIYGRNILSSTKNLYHGAVDVAYAHHERLDGKGYPRGLKAAALTPYARMVAITSSYDELVTGSAHTAPVTPTLALKQLLAQRGTAFDTELVNQFIKMIGLYPVGTIVELMNGCVAIVIAKNYRYQHLPRVIIVLDEHKQATTERVVDLGKTIDQQTDSDLLIRTAHIDGSFGISLRHYIEKGLVINR